jgi:hypothetical protein
MGEGAAVTALLGGPFSGLQCTLTRTPKRIEVAGVLYERIDDPDTGEFLDGYAATEEQR